MKIYSTRNVLGVFALNDTGEVLGFIPFRGNRLTKIAEKSLLEEERELIEKFGEEIIFEVDIEGFANEIPNKAGEFLRLNPDHYLKEIGVERESYNLKLTEVCFAVTSEKV